VAVAAFDKDAREELDEINVFLANVSDKVAPEKLDGQGAEINVFANAVAVAAFEKVTREELDGQGASTQRIDLPSQRTFKHCEGFRRLLEVPLGANES